MCGLLAYFSTDADRVDDSTVAAVRTAQHCLRHRGPDETEAVVRRPRGLRLQPAVLHRHRAQPPADALRRRPVPDRLQR